MCFSSSEYNVEEQRESELPYLIFEIVKKSWLF